MKYAIVIPARYKSSRFEGKPLAKINGKEMIKYVWDVAKGVLGAENAYIATESEEIRQVCEEYGMRVIMTSESCLTGTDRVYEASLQIDADVLINVQGDEPLIDVEDIRKVVSASQENSGKVINAMCEIENRSDFFSLNVPKIVVAPSGDLLYMSRAPIPGSKSGEFVFGKKQVCIYAFPKKALIDFYNYGRKTPLEKVEDIEILRFLELGYDVKMVEVSKSSVAVDTPEDLARVEHILNTNVL